MRAWFHPTSQTLLCLAIGVVLLAVGCQSKGREADEPVTTELGKAWVPRPVALRVYPSTRFIRDAGVAMLEARFELLDEMGDPVKSSGQARFDLFATMQTPGIEVGRLLYSWDVPLTKAEDQVMYFDPITQGYLMRLRLESSEAARQGVTLRVTFQPPTGQRLSDERGVRTGW